MMQAIIVSGPPGSGKSTQARKIAERYSLFHFDTGRFLNEKTELEEKLASGDIVDSRVVLPLVKKEIKEISENTGIILSGSPRTVLEAMGDDELEGLIPYLSNIYGKKNIHVFKIEIPGEVSIERNSKRKDHRADDKPEIIRHRIDEYKEDTLPMYKEIEKGGYSIYRIDGTPSREEVFDQIKTILDEQIIHQES